MEFEIRWISPKKLDNENYNIEIPLAIRHEVFIEEQKFACDADEIDEISYHVVISHDGKPIGTARVFYYKEGNYKVGRVAILKSARGKGVGYILMKACEDKIVELGGNCIILGAQCRVMDFYKKNGYIAFGVEYLDEYCPHMDMRKIL